MIQLDETHDPERRSWVASANAPASDFPIQNLPFCIVSRLGGRPGGGIAIGDRILDLRAVLDRELLKGAAERAARATTGGALNELMALGPAAARELRRGVSDLLAETGRHAASARMMADMLLMPMREATLHLPAAIGGFTDFLTSSYHTERGGRHTRPDSPIPAAFKHLPIAYHSRASSVRLSGEAVRRPHGQWREGSGRIVFGPTRAFDFELELGAFVGAGNALGEPVPLDEAWDHLFGFVLLNDWSARDVQRWESHPLGPFLSKSASTTISPFVVTAEALAPFRREAFVRSAADPPPLPYLSSEADRRGGGLDIALTCDLVTPQLREAGGLPARITETNFRHMYWTFAQMLAHHASNGCNLRPGDLLGSGTISGPDDASRACFAELSERGTTPLQLADGETRAFLEDGDEVVFSGRAMREGFAPIGFGECRGRVAPACAYPLPKA